MAKMRFLCLHGYQQTAAMMQAETPFLQQLLEQTINDQVELVYATGPHPSTPTAAGEPTFAWWDIQCPEYTFSFLSTLLDNEGPFDGLIGFSQGATVSCLIAALLERPTSLRPVEFTACSHGPVKVVVSYSGYHEDDERLQKYYTPNIKTPIIHFISSTDPVISEDRCLRLVKKCEDSEDRVIMYKGSGFHRIPAAKLTTQALKRCLVEVLHLDDDY